MSSPAAAAATGSPSPPYGGCSGCDCVRSATSSPLSNSTRRVNASIRHDDRYSAVPFRQRNSRADYTQTAKICGDAVCDRNQIKIFYFRHKARRTCSHTQHTTHTHIGNKKMQRKIIRDTVEQRLHYHSMKPYNQSNIILKHFNTLTIVCGRPPQYAPAPCKTFLTLKVVSESRVTTWATSVSILVFLGLSVLDLGPMYATDRQTSDAHHRLMPPPYGAWAYSARPPAEIRSDPEK